MHTRAFIRLSPSTTQKEKKIDVVSGGVRPPAVDDEFLHLKMICEHEKKKHTHTHTVTSFGAVADIGRMQNRFLD